MRGTRPAYMLPMDGIDEDHPLTAASCIFSPKDGIAGAASPAPASPVLFPIAFMRGSNARTARRAP